MSKAIQADLVIENVRVYNSYFKAFFSANVFLKDGRIYFIDTERTYSFQAETICGTDLWMIPGFIDIHMHIESSMMTPYAFCSRVAECGVTTIVSEPHEMANVNGIDGILDMIRAGQDSPIDIFYGIPSCVPSSNSDLETTGGMISAKDMERLKQNPRVACVGEVMNYRQIIQENTLEITKFLDYVRRTDPLFPIEGHCPSLVDLDLAKFLSLGINGDHTEHNLLEFRQRFFNGMFVELQEKMLHQEILDFIAEHNLYEHFCFVTDDVMADTLVKEGHLDVLVRKAIQLGMPPEQAIYNATFTPARRMNFLDRGCIAPGKLADFILLDNLEQISILKTFKNGSCIYDREAPMRAWNQGVGFAGTYYHSIHLTPKEEHCFQISYPKDGIVSVRVMEIQDNSTRTQEKIVEMTVRNGILQWEDSGCLLAAVFERYGKNGGIGYGFVTGCCHKHGAVATSYAHDCHNILVAGSNPLDMKTSLNRLLQLQGGLVVSDNGKIQAELQLNIGGILSGSPAREVGLALKQVRKAMLNQGYQHYNPIMSFCTLTLPVSPSLKLTDKGYIDVKNSCIVPLFVPQHNTITIF